ncbi:hypothetical protein BDQ12DRAFT_667334 [Crucibulum laeve]|uniref:Uncharacterized protein n=1 Tax=Crucibulum laeve TaxID=68775 RepID=A0A5C3LVJ6_9AGAR|nr:hypothetical protein BDQ12DRAFT_667334 [Crucibulum laeve]
MAGLVMSELASEYDEMGMHFRKRLEEHYNGELYSLKSHTRASFLSAAGLPSPRPLSEEQQRMIATYYSYAHATGEHAVKLLTRKIAKGEYGQGLGKQIENVLGEAKVLVDMPR